MTRHLTAGEKRTRANAAAAVARAAARANRPHDDDEALAAAYPYVTHARAAQIRREIQETRHHDR